MSKSTANTKRRKKKSRAKQQAIVHGAQRLTVHKRNGHELRLSSVSKQASEPEYRLANKLANKQFNKLENKRMNMSEEFQMNQQGDTLVNQPEDTLVDKLESKQENKQLNKLSNNPVNKLASKATTFAPLWTSISRHDPSDDWKPILQQYITICNQLEIAQYGGRLSQYTLDQMHNERAEERLRRLRERDLSRGVQVVGSEMKAEIISVNELDQEVIVNVKLHLTRKILQTGKQYVEERFDQERLWLTKEEENWQIVRVEPIISERRPRHVGASQSWSQVQDSIVDEEPPVTRPYLNPDMLSGFRYIRATTPYLREEAVAYADTWWNKPNPSYEEFEANCTNYVSQCLFAGKAPMLYTNRRDSGWWYKGRGAKGKEWWSYSWAVSRSLAAFLSKGRNSGLRAVEVERADQLQLGDVIFYDWNGNNSFQHTTIVTAFDSNGQPLVNANTNASRHRYWDYQDSYAWTPSTRYRFFHISEMM